MSEATVGAAVRELMQAQLGYDAALAQMRAAKKDPQTVAEARLALTEAAAQLVRVVETLETSQDAFARAIEALAAARILASSDDRLASVVAAMAATERALITSRERLAAAGRILREAREQSDP